MDSASIKPQVVFCGKCRFSKISKCYNLRYRKHRNRIEIQVEQYSETEAFKKVPNPAPPPKGINNHFHTPGHHHHHHHRRVIEAIRIMMIVVIILNTATVSTVVLLLLLQLHSC